MENDQITDFELLSTAANYIKNDFLIQDEAWVGSPFEWVRKLSSSSKGKLGKHLVYQWCALKGLPVGRSPDSEADMLVNEHRVEIKFSTLWNAGFYKFQQIRNQNYEYMVCMGISPNEAHCWVVNKSILHTYVIGHMAQHTGSGSQETDWLTIRPTDPPNWLDACGGSLSEAYKVLKRLSN